MQNSYERRSPDWDMGERVRALEVTVHTDSQRTHEAMVSVWGHMRLTDERAAKASEGVTLLAAQITKLAAVFVEQQADSQRRIEQTQKAYKTAMAAVRWLATAAIIAASASGKMTSETAHRALNLFTG